MLDGRVGGAVGIEVVDSAWTAGRYDSKGAAMRSKTAGLQTPLARILDPSCRQMYEATKVRREDLRNVSQSMRVLGEVVPK